MNYYVKTEYAYVESFYCIVNMLNTYIYNFSFEIRKGCLERFHGRGVCGRVRVNYECMRMYIKDISEF